MKRNRFQSAVALVVMIFASQLGADERSVSGASPPVGRPNVLFIAVDDLRPELTCYGANGLVTPNFDRLAATGTRFDRAYCQQAVCGASRLSIMGGLYPINSRELTYHVRGWRQRHPGLLTINQHFRNVGFETVGLGKIYHDRAGAGADQSGWDQWINVRESMYLDPDNLAHKRTFSVHKPETKLGSVTEALDVPDDSYADGKRTARTLEFLKARKTSDKPFFLAMGFVKPHLPFVAPKRYWDLYDRAQFSMPENTGIPPGYPDFAANRSAWELKFYVDYEGSSPTDFSDDLNRRLLHGYAACTSYVDACLGRILDALDETGLSENTIIVLWGDHGYRLGEHSSWTKHTNFETDARVPLLIRVPGGTGGQVSGSLVELIDLYPTLCELTGIEVPAHCQGRSFAKLLEHPDADHRDSAYSSYPAEEGISEKEASGMVDAPPSQLPEMGMGHSLRFDSYRYTEWRPRLDEAATDAVLTDLDADPGETTNVIDDPAHSEALARARRLLSQRIACSVGPDSDPD